MPDELGELASLPAPSQRKESKQRLKRQVHELSKEGLTYSAIAGEVGLHRVTVKKWIGQEPPPDQPQGPDPATPEVIPVPPPDPWSSWDEVRQVREALREHRFLLLRRPQNLTPEEQEQVNLLLASPMGSRLQVVRSFLEDWYSLWFDEARQRRSRSDAETRYEAWRSNSDYRNVPQLRRLLARMTPGKFERLSQFLRHPHWEATSNGAERGGRSFRHSQSPHFNLRKKEHIERKMNVMAHLRKDRALRGPSRRFHTCQRGRRKWSNFSAN